MVLGHRDCRLGVGGFARKVNEGNIVRRLLFPRDRTKEARKGMLQYGMLHYSTEGVPGDYFT